MNEEIEIEIKQSENRLRWAKFWKSTLPPILKFLFKWGRRGLFVAIPAAAGSVGTHYYQDTKPPEKPITKPQIKLGPVIHAKTRIIHESINYAKIQAMIDKAIQQHEQRYHQ